MPVTTSISENAEPTINSETTVTNMATKAKTLTFQDILNSIDKLEAKMSTKFDDQLKIVQDNFNAANKKIEDKIDSLETGLSAQSDEMTEQM